MLLMLLAIIYGCGDFMAVNRDPITISLLVWNLGPYPVYGVVTFSFTTGLALMLILSSLDLLRSRLMISRQSKKINKLTRELEKQENEFRN